jgi:chemotaxis signal transduction protein
MKEIALQPVHTLEIPMQTLSLLVPSACIAEVTSVVPLTPLPRSPVWVLGVVGWRSRPVTIISMDALVNGGVRPVVQGAKMVVLYPLPGRPSFYFFGFLASAEPQSHTIDSTVAAENADTPDNAFIAASIRLARGVAGIPDFDALARALYPKN